MAVEQVACACCGWVEDRSRAEFICTFCGLGQVCIPFEQCSSVVAAEASHPRPAGAPAVQECVGKPAL